MADLFRIESPRVVVRWAELGPRPPTLGAGTGHLGFVSASPADRCNTSFPAGEAPRLFEQTDYRLTVKCKGGEGSRVDLVHRDPELLRGVLPPEEAALWLRVGTINFRSQVGRSRFDILVDGRHELTFEVEVFPAKLDYRADYEQLLAEVQSILTSLAFEYLKSTHVSADTYHGPPTALEWVIVLRSIVDRLEVGLRHVARHPVRALRRETQLQRVDRIRRADSSVRRAVRTGAGRGEPVALTGGVKARAELPTSRAEPTLDTPEHRWLADHLRRCRSHLAELIAAERAHPFRSARRATTVDELSRMESRIDRLLRTEPLQRCAAPPPAGFSSLQLLRAAGYREAYLALVTLQLGLRLEGNALELSLKDISTLYEYWCYLAVVDLIVQKTGRQIDPARIIGVSASGLQVLLKKGRTTSIPFDISPGRRVIVEYNRVFRNDVLFQQQPDIVLEVHEAGWPTARVVLDAKYRIDVSPESTRLLGIPGPPADALNVLHRYRDAILTDEPTPGEGQRLSRSVVYAAALYPLSLDAGSFRNSKLHSQLRVIGVGAIPFLPSNRELLSRWLDEIMGLDRWALAQAAIPVAPDPWIWKAGEEPVLVGVLRSASKEQPSEHLEWIQRQNLYYQRDTAAGHGRQRAARQVAIYVPASHRPDGIGAVAWVAEVVDIAVVPRESIHTPWAARAPAEPVRLYRLAHVRPHEPGIRNDEGQRFSISRWSNRLALSRARSIDELFLESPLEWSLFDALRSGGWQFRVRAGGVRALGPDAAPGRARFVLDDLRIITYVGAGGFDIESAATRERYPTVQKTIAGLRKRK